MKRISLFSILLFIGAQYCMSQSSFRVSLLSGTAKVQQSQDKEWRNITYGDKINDNDMVETFFRTKLILHYGVENMIILGSNSKALLNIKRNEDNIDEVNITLFSGGILSKTMANARVNIYTTNATAQIESGTISTIVEAKTGHSGFQVLGGGAEIRNISQQQWKKLGLGLTTIVLPDKEPTAPLYLTYRHVEVLKHFFGDEFIDREIEAAGIEPTEDQSSTNRLSLTQNLMQRSLNPDGGMEKKLFSYNKIFGYIIDDKKKKEKRYIPINKPRRLVSNKGEVILNSSFGIAGTGMYPSFSAEQSFNFPRFSVGLRIPFAKNSTGKVSMNFASASGVFDKISHLKIGNEEISRYFKLGPIEEYTIADGLVVNSLYNKNIYTVTQPLGIILDLKSDAVGFDMFVSDITNWYVGGLHFDIHWGDLWIGNGYYYDANQYKTTLHTKNSRFIDVDTLEKVKHVYPTDSMLNAKSSIHIYELNFGYTHFISDDIKTKLLFQIASKMGKHHASNDTVFIESDPTKYVLTDTKNPDYVLKGPDMRVEFNGFDFGLSYIHESGRMLERYFNQMYMSNRLRIDEITNDTIYYKTQNCMLPSQRKAYGICAFFNTNPIKGTAVALNYRQDFLTRTIYKAQYQETVNNVVTKTKDTTIYLKEKNNFSYTLKLLMNDTLFQYIKYAELFLNQIHGSYFPEGGKYFASWGFSTGLHALSAPLFFNLAFETRVLFTYLDLKNSYGKVMFNNNIDPGDILIEFCIGIHWGFL